MAATNYTPIQLYYSTTASAAPVAGNLASGELAINITDGKLYYKDNGGVVQVIATKGAGTIGGSDTQIQYNNAGALAGNAAMTFNSGTSTVTLTTLNLTNALGATYGGTAQSTYTQGDILYSSAANTLAKLGIGTANYILTSTGSVPQWVAPSSVTVQTANNLAGGAAGSVPYQSAADTTTFLAIGTANRVMTSSGTAPQWVTSLSGLTGVSSSSITNTSLTSGRVVYSTTGGAQTDDADLTFNGTTLSAGGYSTSGLSTLVKTVTIGNSNFDGTAVFAAATPAKLYIGTGTVTDTTSAIGATNATGAIASLAITPIAATNTSVTYTNASTLYIAGAPTAGTNVTITNPYSLYVAGGAAYFGGAVTYAGGINFNGNVTVGASSANTLTVNSTITSNLIFTDNTYDIGASGATRPRSIYLSGTATLGGSGVFLTANGAVFQSTYAGVTTTNLFTDSGGGVLSVDGNNTISLRTGGVSGTTTATITSSGIGVFTNNPGGALEIFKTSTTVPNLRLRYNSTSYFADHILAPGGQYTIYSPPANGVTSGTILLRAGTDIQFATNNNPYSAVQMTLSTVGNLGINTTGPNAKLEVSIAAATSGEIARFTSPSYDSVYIAAGASANSCGIGTLSSSAFNLFVNSSSKVTVLDSGYVGIGTVSPSKLLQVTTGSTAKTEVLFLQSVNGFAAGAGTFIRTGSGGNNSVVFGFDYDSSSFQVQGGSTGSAIMSVLNSGSVGIGTTSPVALLNVVSGTNTTLSVPSGVVAQFKGGVVINSLSTASSGTVDSLYFQKSHTSGINIANYDLGIIKSFTGNGYTGGFDFYTSKSIGGGSYASTFAMRIDELQNVGVQVVPATWASDWSMVQVGSLAGFGQYSGTASTMVTHNYYNSGTGGSAPKYLADGYASVYQQASGYHYWYSAPSNSSGAGADITDFTQVLSVRRNESLALQGGYNYSGTGVTFPATQSASSNANTLDDYEEGSFTVALQGGSGAGTWSPAYNAGRYTKVGRVVNFSFVLGGTLTGASGNLLVTGLPFTISNTNQTAAVNEYRYMDITGYNQIGFEMVDTTTYGYFYMSGISKSESQIPVGNWSSGGDSIVWVSGSYTTST